METLEGHAPTPTIRPRADAGKRRNPAAVERLVRAELLPRVALVHVAEGRSAKAKTPSRFDRHEIVEFAEAALQTDASPLLARVERHVAAGSSLEAVYLDLMQPAARHLGDRWSEDSLSFAAVTLGLCQMHRAVRELSPAFQVDSRQRNDGCHALLTPAGKEQQSLGLVMVGEFLRREGWLVSNGPFSSEGELAATVRAEWFTFVGFSLSCDSGLDALASQIRCVRRASLNRTTWVLVGGRVFIDHPELAARIGADAMACDAKQAAMISRRLAATPAERRA
jgi:methanogenic corrinoid protein MtbC1